MGFLIDREAESICKVSNKVRGHARLDTTGDTHLPPSITTQIDIYILGCESVVRRSQLVTVQSVKAVPPHYFIVFLRATGMLLT